MADATAFITSGEIQTSQDWYAWYFDRANGYMQAEEGWYEWNFARAPLMMEVTTSISEPSVQSTAVFALPSLEVSSSISEITASVPAAVVLPSLNVISSITPITADVSAIAVMPSLLVSSSLGQIIVKTTKESKVVASGRIYKLQKENASVHLRSMRVRAEIGEVLARGTIKINNVVKLASISVEVGMDAINAEGVLDISDEEFILLMAA